MGIPTPPPLLYHWRHGNELETIALEVVGGFPRAHWYNYATRFRSYGILERKMMQFVMGVIGKW